MNKTEELLLIMYQLWYSTIATKAISASISLTGSSTALSAVNCKGVTLLSACTIVVNGGASMAVGPGLNIPCNSTSEIAVSGSGTLNYLILQ